MDRDRFFKIWERGCSMNGGMSIKGKRAWTMNKEVSKIHDELIAAGTSILPYFREIFESTLKNQPRLGFWDTFYFINLMNIGHPEVPKEARGKVKEVAKIYFEFLNNWCETKQAKCQSHKRLADEVY